MYQIEKIPWVPLHFNSALMNLFNANRLPFVYLLYNVGKTWNLMMFALFSVLNFRNVDVNNSCFCMLLPLLIATHIMIMAKKYMNFALPLSFFINRFWMKQNLIAISNDQLGTRTIWYKVCILFQIDSKEKIKIQPH